MGNRAPLCLALALAACGGDRGEPPPPRVQTAELTGLYQGPAAGPERSRLCMIADGPGRASFALVVSGPGNGLCSGAGQAVREGAAVRLEMSGDEACAIETRLSGTELTFPAAVPEACAYYCGPGGSLAGAAFTKTGGSAADAMKARDLAGDALCG